MISKTRFLYTLKNNIYLVLAVTSNKMYSYPEQNLELVSVTSELNQDSHTSLLIISTSPYFK